MKVILKCQKIWDFLHRNNSKYFLNVFLLCDSQIDAVNTWFLCICDALMTASATRWGFKKNVFPHIISWGSTKIGVSQCRKVGSTHFFSYFKKRVGKRNTYIGSCVYLPPNQSYTRKNIDYVSPYSWLVEHLLKQAYLCVGRLDRLAFFSSFKRRVGQTNNCIGSCLYLLHCRSYMLKKIGGQNSQLFHDIQFFYLHLYKKGRHFCSRCFWKSRPLI